MNKEDNYLSTSQVANILGVTKATVSSMCREGLLYGATKQNNTWKIPKSSIDSWQKGQTNANKRQTASEKWEQIKSHPWIFWPLLLISGAIVVIGILFASISAGADFGFFQKQLYQWELIRHFPPRQTNETLIVIANFDTGNDDSKSDIQEELRLSISEQVAKLNLSNNLRIEIDPTVIAADDQPKALTLAERHDASIIIWGSDTDFRIQVNFLAYFSQITDRNIPPLLKSTIEETQRTNLASPSEYVSFVTEELNPQITFLSLYAIGHANFGRGNYETTIIAIESALKEYELNLDLQIQNELDSVWVLLATAYYNNGDRAKGRILFDEIIDSYPESTLAHINRGWIRFFEKNNEGALSDFNRAVMLSPNSLDALLARGFYYLNINDPNNAEIDYNAIIEIDPQIYDAYIGIGLIHQQLSNDQKALENFDKAIQFARFDFELVSSLTMRASHFLSVGEYELAKTDLDKIISIDPNNADNYLNRSIYYSTIGDNKEQLRDIEKAIEINPNYYRAYFALGNYYLFIQTDFRKSIEYYSICINLGQQYPCYINRALAYKNTNNIQLAENDLTKAISLNPFEEEAYIYRANIYLSQDEYEKALQDLNAYLPLEDEDPERFEEKQQLIDSIEVIIQNIK